MTSLDLRDTRHVRFGTPCTTDLNVIPPPLNIVSFSKRRCSRATSTQPRFGHAHDLASCRRACDGPALSRAIHPTFLQPALPAKLLEPATSITPSAATIADPRTTRSMRPPSRGAD